MGDFFGSIGQWIMGLPDWFASTAASLIYAMAMMYSGKSDILRLEI
jgi:hypothetical protein